MTRLVAGTPARRHREGNGLIHRFFSKMVYLVTLKPIRRRRSVI